MKQLREIVFKSLVDNLGVDPTFLSRVEGNAPIAIELKGGEEICVYFQEKNLQTYIEIPIKDSRLLSLKASKFIEVLANDELMYTNFQKDKIVVFSEFSKETKQLEQQLSEKLSLFNKLAHTLTR